MIIQSTAKVFITLNAFLLLLKIFIGAVFYFGLSPDIATYSTLAVVEITLLILVNTGLLLVLIKLGESPISITVLLAYVLFQCYLVARTILQINGWIEFTSPGTSIQWFSYILLVCLGIGLCTISNPAIRAYYRYSGILTMAAFAISRLLPVLYDEFGLKPFVLMPLVLSALPLMASLALFVSLSRPSREYQYIETI